MLHPTTDNPTTQLATAIELITGEFTIAEASEVLHSLFYDKINFHARRAHSLRERFGSDTTDIERRIDQLKEIKSQLNSTLSKAAGSSEKIRLTANVNVVPVNNTNR